MYSCYVYSKLRISLGLKPLEVKGAAQEETEEMSIEGSYSYYVVLLW